MEKISDVIVDGRRFVDMDCRMLGDKHCSRVTFRVSSSKTLTYAYFGIPYSSVLDRLRTVDVEHTFMVIEPYDADAVQNYIDKLNEKE